MEKIKFTLADNYCFRIVTKSGEFADNLDPALIQKLYNVEKEVQYGVKIVTITSSETFFVNIMQENDRYSRVIVRFQASEAS